MLIGLPVISFFLFILFYRNKFPSLGWRESYILSAVTLGFSSVIFVEIASLFSAVSASWVIAFWITMFFLSLRLSGWTDLKSFSKFFKVPELGAFEYACMAGIILIMAMNAVVAFSYPPNNWDSMTYHLPRVMHWATNRSVDFYPTHIDRQIFYPPAAEYLLLHVFLLSGDDRWFNFLQWGSYLGCVLSASLIAKILGAGSRGQVLTALFVASIPMAILQSTSTQNDLVVSFWIMAFVALVFSVQKESRIVVYTAPAALGLCALTKGTFFVALPFVVYFLIILWKKKPLHIFVSIGIVLLLISGYYLRSWAWHGGLFDINKQSEVMMIRHDPAVIIVNGASQIATEFMLPWDSVNQAVERLVQKETVWLGVDAKDKNVFGQLFVKPLFPNLVFDEDLASNPLHMMLIIVVLFVLWKIKPRREVWLYGLSALGASLLFVIFASWSPFITRLHLPLFILFSPLVGLGIGHSWQWLGKLIAVLLFGTALLTICHHQSRPLSELNNPNNFPHEAYYFMKKRPHFWSYEQAAHLITSSGCLDVGLLENVDSWEYPLWAMTGFGKVRFHNLMPNSGDIVEPCMIVTLDYQTEKPIVRDKRIFNLIWQGYPLQIFKITGTH